jgi:hypothetical protein
MAKRPRSADPTDEIVPWEEQWPERPRSADPTEEYIEPDKSDWKGMAGSSELPACWWNGGAVIWDWKHTDGRCDGKVEFGKGGILRTFRCYGRWKRIDGHDDTLELTFGTLHHVCRLMPAEYGVQHRFEVIQRKPIDGSAMRQKRVCDVVGELTYTWAMQREHDQRKWDSHRQNLWS